MKKLLKFSFLLVSLVGFAYAKPYGTVTELKGRAFGVHDEKTFTLKVGYKLPQETDIITEEGAQISFIDFHDRKYHLSGSAHIKVTDHVLKLNRGYLWVQSFQKNEELLIRTANALTEFLFGEGILSFDNASGRSQLLTVKGELKFAHVLDVNRYEVLQPGEFSTIDHENGTPRRATPIGFESYEKIISLFRMPKQKRWMAQNGKPVIEGPQKRIGQRTTQNKSKAKRLPASYRGGSVPIIKTKWTAKQVKNLGMDLRSLYLGQLGTKKKTAAQIKKSKARKRLGYSPVTTRVFGLKRRRSTITPAVDQRQIPALAAETVEKKAPMVKLQKSQRAPASQEAETSSPWGFEQALRKHLKKTSRHKLESNGLIEELKNYRQDYKINY